MRSWNWRSVQPDGDRGRLPGARRGVFLAARDESLEEGRVDGQGGGIQLLSRQEPGGLRRSWRGHDERSRNWPGRSACCATTAKRRSITTIWKATTAGWTRFRPGILNVKLQHLPDWTRSGRQRGENTRRCSASTESWSFPTNPPGPRRYITSTWYGWRSARTTEAAARGRIGTGIHYPVPLHLQKAYCAWLPRGRFSGGGEGNGKDSFVADVPWAGREAIGRMVIKA